MSVKRCLCQERLSCYLIASPLSKRVCEYKESLTAISTLSSEGDLCLQSVLTCHIRQAVDIFFHRAYRNMFTVALKTTVVQTVLNLAGAHMSDGSFAAALCGRQTECIAHWPAMITDRNGVCATKPIRIIRAIADLTHHFTRVRFFRFHSSDPFPGSKRDFFILILCKFYR